jgi:hypothetical protein
MKQKTYIFGVLTALIIFTGAIFKINHWAGAGIMLTTGLATLVLIFIPVALINNYKAEGNRQNRLLYIVTSVTCFVVFTAMLFKIQHWPYAGLLLTVALPFPYVVFLPVFLIVTSRNKNFSIYSMVFILLLLAGNSVFTALLSLNVTKDRISDSYNLSRNYNRLETVLSQTPDTITESPLAVKIDEVLKIVYEYKELILKQEGISAVQWNNDAGSLVRPDSKGLAAHALLDAGEPEPGTRLMDGLNGLVNEIKKTSGCEELAKEAPVIFDTVSPTGREDDWCSWKFADNNLSWVLIYLDGLETNLKMIRATVK